MPSKTCCVRLDSKVFVECNGRNPCCVCARAVSRVVRGAVFLVGGVLGCALAHRRSVVVLCMLFKTRSNPMHLLRGAVPLSYVPECVTRGALVAHMHSCVPPRCRTSQYRRTFVPSQCLFGTILVALYLMVWEWLVLRAEPMLSRWPNLLFFLSPVIFFFSSFHALVVMGWGLWMIDLVFTLSPELALLILF